jgi:hypothetical protein
VDGGDLGESCRMGEDEVKVCGWVVVCWGFT